MKQLELTLDRGGVCDLDACSVHPEWPEVVDTSSFVDSLREEGLSADILPIEHFFSEHQYTRIIKVWPGLWIIGKKHRFKTLNFLLQGEIMQYLGENKPPRLMKAPFIFESPPGVQKIGYALSTVLFANVHVTEETDLAKIEKQFIVSEDEPDGLGVEENDMALLHNKGTI